MINSRARVDLIVDDGESLIVADLKTSRSRWGQSQVESNAEQLLLYSELVRRLSPDKNLRLQFAVITKSATRLNIQDFRARVLAP